MRSSKPCANTPNRSLASFDQNWSRTAVKGNCCKPPARNRRSSRTAPVWRAAARATWAPGPTAATPAANARVLDPKLPRRSSAASRQDRPMSSRPQSALQEDLSMGRNMGKKNGPQRPVLIDFLAERVGFEPTVPCGTPDFESSAQLKPYKNQHRCASF